MPSRPLKPFHITREQARRIWLRAQRLDSREPFGEGPEATAAAVAHLGYVQIDTIAVVERCHHHILWNRIPTYSRAHLQHAHSVEKSVFEYWTHALSYIPAQDFRFFMPAMKRHKAAPSSWFGTVTPADMNKVLRLIRKEGPLSIRDIEDDVLVEKEHPWASRKPSKRALQHAFYSGTLTISARAGMVKTYELTERHFGWENRPRQATERQVNDYVLDRALKAQGIVSLDSICHLDAKRKPAVREHIEARMKRRMLVPVTIEDGEAGEHWAAPETLDALPEAGEPLVHILSPFDPLIIQRKRLKLFFGYEHRFEAYVPRNKRVYGYFALPVLLGDRIVAALDLKADRAKGELLIRQWTDVAGAVSAGERAAIDAELERFSAFQFAD
ncbi:winged helix-turn-helix domain-containing protein [Aurantimonas sp. VKM B-3413]|uniref:winged helix-turn-helix domain-containing protein n=1 Tax=Aurantimonas sp. VKM B-3413 TaxID=2779401 RepID=UPI001E37216E|nr:crosslink repair DNA glycosylase YcaQ family protein [Aurantimonas sp. VKM B-3413]MCB8839839.1 winged helix DNA-binding domain-containing protein [Aurantimonas sp. VKM B-3413]